MTQDTDSGAIALVDDDDDLRAATTQLLSLHGYSVTGFADAASALKRLDEGFPGIVVTDVRMPGMSGIELFRALGERDPELPVIVITGHGDIEMAVDALKAGAWDFLTKPFQPATLIAAVARAARARRLTLENRWLRALADETAGQTLVGEAPAIRQLRGLIPVLADAALDVVIEGQSGTGKELFGRLVHRAGRRSRHRFLSIDCATLPASVAERELFVRNGILARANRGTLFLDNLAVASENLQHRLASFVEARAVGLDTRDPEPVDVRIVATLPEGGRERVLAALYHQLAGMPLRMPPLAERVDDIPLLFSHLVLRAASTHGITPPPLAAYAHRLKNRAWPGNVRELEKAAERFCLGLEPGVGEDGTQNASLPARVDAFEREVIVEAIRAAGGEIGAAIETLQIPRNTFYYRARRLGIDIRRLRTDS
jgi:two-component system C4-dicarboxylate transport response regulator DctD